MALFGDLASIAENTQPRRAYVSQFLKDVSFALSISPDRISVDGLRAGSIVIDFVILEGDKGMDPGACLRELKRQVMDPSSALMQGNVTNSVLKVQGEVERYVEEPEPDQTQGDIDAAQAVRRSGHFSFSQPEDRTLEIPGAYRSKKKETTMKAAKTSTLPIRLKNGKVAKNGERDMPAFLYYYPGGEQAEEQKKRVAAASKSPSKRPVFKPKVVEQDEEEVLKTMGLTAGMRQAMTSSGLIVDREESKAAGGPALTNTGTGSVLADILREMGSKEQQQQPSILARLFVELLAVQKQAVLRKVRRRVLGRQLRHRFLLLTSLVILVVPREKRVRRRRPLTEARLASSPASRPQPGRRGGPEDLVRFQEGEGDCSHVRPH